MNEEIKRNIRSRWINSIFELAHFEFQNRLWLKADYQNTVGSFTECVCNYFDDLSLEDGYSDFISNGIISDIEFEIVKKLHSEFEKYIDRTEMENSSDKNILKDSKWVDITNLGLKTWIELKNNLDSEFDIKLISDLENRYLINDT